MIFSLVKVTKSFTKLIKRTTVPPTTSSLEKRRQLSEEIKKLIKILNNYFNKETVARNLKKFVGPTMATSILLTAYYIQRNRNSGRKMPIKNLAKVSNESKGNAESMRTKYNFINKVVSSCAPAVFYLEIRDPYKKDMETGEPMITSNGSGFLISEDGWALTNAHVVLNKPQSTIRAIMKDGKSYKVQVEDADMNVDIALLKLEAIEKLPSLQFCESGDTGVGEWVVALGSPLSLSNSVTVGIVSCVDRPAEDLGLKNYSMTYIQTDASITFGNSGGPLVNLDGDVIGINNLRLTSGISFAIPVEYVKKFLDNSKYRIKNGKSIGPMGKTLYGITTISITPDVLSDLLRDNKNIPHDVNQGLLVWKVIPDSPAQKCGMEVGDIITHVNGMPVREPVDLYSLISSNERIRIKLVHKGTKKSLTVVSEVLK